jgi:hypothetical protein
LVTLTEEVSAPTVMGTLEKAAQRNDSKPPAGDPYSGLPTGTFKMPPLSTEAPSEEAAPVGKQVDLEAIEALEKKFWALMRILARRGLVTKDEFLAELRWTDDAAPPKA